MQWWRSALPAKGTLRRAGTPLPLNGTFTQAGIDAGLVAYQQQAGGDDAMDALTVSLSDGSTTLNGQVLRIMVGPGSGSS